MPFFTFSLPQTIISGRGCLSRLGEEAQKLGSKALIVTGQTSTRHFLTQVVDLLNHRGIHYAVFSEIEPDPSIETVERGAAFALQKGCDFIIGLGGGSPLDAAKAIGALVTNGGNLRDYLGVDKIPKPMLPLIAIPTTAGTGSEVTPVSVVSVKEENIKLSISSPHLLARVAIVDPLLTVTMPPYTTACTGMDALTHAIETYVSNGAQLHTDALALEAIRLIGNSLRTAVNNGNNLDAREQMMMASLMAGMAFGNAGLGAVHAMAHPLGARYHLAHGLSCALMLPHVLEFNQSACPEKYRKIAAALEGPHCESAADAIRRLMHAIGLPLKLSEVGVKESSIPLLVEGSLKSRSLRKNPRPVAAEDLAAMFSKAI